jgi:hypothetical protein
MSDTANPQPVQMPLAPPKPNSTMAIISLIAGITGWTILPLFGSLVAVITGHLAKSEIKKSMGTLGGSGMATAGLVLGYLILALGLCICVISGLGYSFGDLIIQSLNSFGF